MRKVIISIEFCQKCEMLKAQCPDAEVIKEVLSTGPDGPRLTSSIETSRAANQPSV